MAGQRRYDMKEPFSAKTLQNFCQGRPLTAKLSIREEAGRTSHAHQCLDKHTPPSGADIAARVRSVPA